MKGCFYKKEAMMFRVNWMEKVTVEVPCWWRRLLGLPPRTITEWQRFMVYVDAEALEDVEFPALREVRAVQFEPVTLIRAADIAEQIITPMALEPGLVMSMGCDWGGEGE
jgi:hypothetical protein